MLLSRLFDHIMASTGAGVEIGWEPGPTATTRETGAGKGGILRTGKGKGTMTDPGGEIEMWETIASTETAVATTLETGTAAGTVVVTGTEAARTPAREIEAVAPPEIETGVGTRGIGVGAGIVTRSTTPETGAVKAAAMAREGELIFLRDAPGEAQLSQCAAVGRILRACLCVGCVPRRAFLALCHRLTACSAVSDLTHRRDRGAAAPMDGGRMDGGRAGGREPFRGRGAYLLTASRSADTIRTAWTRPLEQPRFDMRGDGGRYSRFAPVHLVTTVYMWKDL